MPMSHTTAYDWTVLYDGLVHLSRLPVSHYSGQLFTSSAVAVWDTIPGKSFQDRLSQLRTPHLLSA